MEKREPAHNTGHSVSGIWGCYRHNKERIHIERALYEVIDAFSQHCNLFI
jgi:hypothetical protein